MTRKLKKIGFALFALLAASAIPASSALALPFTSPGAGASQKTFLTGEQSVAFTLTLPGGTVKCTNFSLAGSVTGFEQTTVTLAPTYTGCNAFGFASSHIKPNGCTYRFEAPTTEPSAGQYTAVPFRINCAAGKQIEITPTSFGASVCTQFLAEQAPSKVHVVYSNNAERGPVMGYLANATVEGISYTGTGGSCAASGTNGTYSGQTTIKGYEDEAHKNRFGVTVAVPGLGPAYPFTSPGANTGQKTFLTGEQTATFTFTLPGGTVKCTTLSVAGSVAGPEQTAVTLAPTTSGCMAFGFATAHIKPNGCTYRLEVPTTEPSAGQYTGAPLQFRCPAGKQIEITPTSFGVSVCTQSIADQNPTSGHVIYSNNAELGSEMDYLANATAEGIHYTGTGGSCAASGTNGTYSGQMTIKGYEDEAHKFRYGVTVAVPGTPYPFTAPGAGVSQNSFITGEQVSTFSLGTPGGTVTCTAISLAGSAKGPEQSQIALSPSYSGCKAFGFGNAHVNANGCTYRFEAPTTEPSAGQYTGAPLQFRCPAGKQIEITPTTFGVSVCTQKIGEQNPTGGHNIYSNNSESGVKMDFLANVTAEGIHYTGTGGVCGTSGTNGTYSGQSTLRGYESEAHSVSFGVTVA